MSAIVMEVLTAEDLFDRARTEPENEDLFGTRDDEGREHKRLKYLDAGLAHDQMHIVASSGRRIVGMAGLSPNPYETDVLWATFVSVEEGYRGHGIARLLIEGIYNYAVAQGNKVEPSSFTELGQRLKHIFDQFDALHPQAACGLPRKDF